METSEAKYKYVLSTGAYVDWVENPTIMWSLDIVLNIIFLENTKEKKKNSPRKECLGMFSKMIDTHVI